MLYAIKLIHRLSPFCFDNARLKLLVIYQSRIPDDTDDTNSRITDDKLHHSPVKT